jgi:hypothetical protein
VILLVSVILLATPHEPAHLVLGDSVPAPTGAPVVADVPNDNGHGLDVEWTASPDEVEGSVTGYEIWRSETPGGPFELRGRLPAGAYQYRDRGEKNPASSNYFPAARPYYYRVRTVSPTGFSDSQPSAPVSATGQWYHTGKTPVLVGSVIFAALALYFIRAARAGKKLYIRPLAGIEAVDEAIGRATEMGKPILYLLGSATASGIATIASYAILARVARKTAEYKTRLMVPTKDPVVMTVAQETVKSAYSEAGHPDAYQDDMVFYITSMQFAFVAAVSGIMLREKPATNFYMGSFYAESLILAETGNAAGSIQISGTDRVAQIPFFVVATDYTLIGEEFFAASAYLGRDPLLLGPLKAQDYAKAILVAALLAGVITVSFGWNWVVGLFEVNL